MSPSLDEIKQLCVEVALLQLDKLKDKKIMSMQTQKRKDNTLEEILRVVQELKELAQVNKAPCAQKIAMKQERRPLRISDVSYGHTFKRKNGEYCIRVRPTSYLLNSTLVSESLCASKQLIVSVKAGTCFFVENEEILLGCTS